MNMKLNEYNRILELAGQAVLTEESDEQKLFRQVIQAKAVNITKKLLKHPKVNPAANNNWAIRYSSFYGYDTIVELLLKDPRIDPTANDNDAIKLASEHGHTEIVKLLKKAIKERNAAKTK